MIVKNKLANLRRCENEKYSYNLEVDHIQGSQSNMSAVNFARITSNNKIIWQNCQAEFDTTVTIHVNCCRKMLFALRT